jgi:hypothetical protein
VNCKTLDAASHDGHPREGPACIHGDDQSVLASCGIPDSTLKKKSQSIAHHFVQEDAARDEWRTSYVNKHDNEANLLTKFLWWEAEGFCGKGVAPCLPSLTLGGLLMCGLGIEHPNRQFSFWFSFWYFILFYFYEEQWVGATSTTERRGGNYDEWTFHKTRKSCPCPDDMNCLWGVFRQRACSSMCCMSQVIDIPLSKPSWIMHALRTASLAAVANMSDRIAHHTCRALDVLALLKLLTTMR